MEFIKTKLWDGEVNVLFAGGNYFFFHGFYGVICIAERHDDVELSNPSSKEVWKSKFTLYSGHSDIDIEKDAFALAKRIIRKHDQKHIKKTFEFEEVVTNLKRCLVTVSYDLNHF